MTSSVCENIEWEHWTWNCSVTCELFAIETNKFVLNRNPIPWCGVINPFCGVQVGSFVFKIAQSKENYKITCIHTCIYVFNVVNCTTYSTYLCMLIWVQNKTSKYIQILYAYIYTHLHILLCLFLPFFYKGKREIKSKNEREKNIKIVQQKKKKKITVPNALLSKFKLKIRTAIIKTTCLFRFEVISCFRRLCIWEKF